MVKNLQQLQNEAIPKIKEIINDDWELMELNPGKPYRNGMKEVHFIKLKVLFEKELQTIVKESFKNTRVEGFEETGHDSINFDTKKITTSSEKVGYNTALSDKHNKECKFLGN